MTQTSFLPVKSKLTEKTPWDKIPQSEVDAYEEEIAQLHRTARGRTFKEACIAIYNRYFTKYGYTKSLSL